MVYIFKPNLPIHPMSAPPFSTFASLFLPCKLTRESQSGGSVRALNSEEKTPGMCHHMLSIRPGRRDRACHPGGMRKGEYLPDFRNSMLFLLVIECLWSK